MSGIIMGKTFEAITKAFWYRRKCNWWDSDIELIYQQRFHRGNCGGGPTVKFQVMFGVKEFIIIKDCGERTPFVIKTF